MITDEQVEPVFNHLEKYFVAFSPKDELIEEIKAALEAYERSKWCNDMSKAPLDNTEVFLCGGEVHDGYGNSWNNLMSVARFCSGDWTVEAGKDDYYTVVKPTHWQYLLPLPTPPHKKPRQFEDAEHSLGGVDQMDNNTRAG